MNFFEKFWFTLGSAPDGIWNYQILYKIPALGPRLDSFFGRPHPRGIEKGTKGKKKTGEGKVRNPTLKKKTTFVTKIILFYLLLTNIVFADLKENLINKLISTETLTFDFKQKIDGKEEIGNCFIKYPLLISIKNKTMNIT